MRLLHLACLVLACACSASAGATVPTADALDSGVRAAMQATGAQGMAIAVIDDGRVVHVRAHGKRNAAGDPLTEDTVMYGASLTKAAFGHAVLQLVQDGRLDLDRSIAEYLPQPLPDYANQAGYGPWQDLAGDERWRLITPRMLLTHSAGFANFAFLEPDGKLRIHFAPGSRYAYSGEGMILLQFVLERGLGVDVGELMQQRVFDPLGMARTSLTWRADFADNLADGWRADGSVEPHDQRSRVRAAGSMDTTMTDAARLVAGHVRGEGLGAEGSSGFLAPGLPITTASQFPTLQPEAPPTSRHPGLTAGLGVVVFEGPQGRGYYKGGHNDSTGNTMVCLERGRRCVVILANDVRAEAAFPALVALVLGETGLPWSWEYREMAFWNPQETCSATSASPDLTASHPCR